MVHVSRVMGAIRQRSRWIQHPEKPLFRPWHMPVAQSNQELDIQGVTRGTRVYGHVAHLGMV